MSVTEKPHIRVVAGRIERDGCYLITQRMPHAVLPLLWEFPGGRVEAGESDADALARELLENLNVRSTVDGLSMHVEHEYERYFLDLMVYRVDILDEPKAVLVNDFRWVAPEEFGDYPFPGADQQTVEALLGE
ncbi:MAG: NUDIX hydrolase [Deltaproteobacteria bacterium]|jgi:8-oxo-dGTP diphosphatase|nr:NUDIX hydrolase [Deltaproteobacteria bacterium]|tara:strand:+ start:526 stop:924 length:399 start_codon:yes stop_codon:yes gene_type:complete